MSVFSVSVERLEQLLPQTQCRQCGYDGCTPYAEALVQGAAAVNLCAPGGETVMRDLAQVLGLPSQSPTTTDTKAIAHIDENACIGCTACIKACPVDAIVGAAKRMHTVIHDECSGCGLCLPPCPVDCIVMQPIDAAWLPLSRSLVRHSVAPQPNERHSAAVQARTRYQHRSQRLARLAAERQAYLASRKPIQSSQSTTPTANTTPSTATPTTASVNAADWVAKAMNRARALQSQRQEPDNQAVFQQRQIAKAQERATYRRAMRDMQYGNAAEKSAALAFLRDYKARQEAERGRES